MKLSFYQKILAGFIISLLLVIGIGASSYRNIENIKANSKLVEHTREVLNSANDVYITILNAETAQRGYISTGNLDFLEPYNQADKEILSKTNLLRELTIDNTSQTKRIVVLTELLQAKMKVLRESIALRKEQGFEAAREYMLKNNGNSIMADIRTVIANINDEETRLLKLRDQEANSSNKSAVQNILLGSLLIVVIIIVLFLFIQRSFKLQLEAEQKVKDNNEALSILSNENEKRNWMLTGASKVNEQLRGDLSVNQLAENTLQTLSNYLEAKVGAMYLLTEQGNYTLTASYAFDYRNGNHNVFRKGEGLLGQAALEKKTICFSNLPSDYIKINSGLGQSSPKSLVVIPLIYDHEVRGLIELGFAGEVLEDEIKFLNTIVESIAIAINAAQSREQLQELLEKTQQQTEELEAQQEELRITNEELHKQTQMLQASEEELRVQQEELRQANDELEAKTELLEQNNAAIEQAREAISLKAKELEITSKYKSEFLANMSHELRTPLNSILILARMLAENKNSSLNEDELKYANVIFNAGNDLLNLINDILDLSKIEAGKIDLNVEQFPLAAVQEDLKLLFTELANSKKINFVVNLNLDEVNQLTSDKQRVEQIIKNLISNSFKFTKAGGEVSISMHKAKPGINFNHEQLKQAKNIIAIAVKDTGIGIAPDKQKIIFEAFQQEDGSTSRKYGGTGLGLSISRELANLLGGEIQLESTPGLGSTFTLYLPELAHLEAKDLQPELVIESYKTPLVVLEKQASANSNNNKLLIVEDDVSFAEILSDYAKDRGFVPILAYDGETGLQLAQKELPAAILLDIKLPIQDGWSVLKAIKSNTDTSHIPVHMMSAMDLDNGKAQTLGAINFLKKPFDTKALTAVFDDLKLETGAALNKVLVVEDNDLQSQVMIELLEKNGIETSLAKNGQEALDLMRNFSFDCIILDLKLPDIHGLSLLDNIRASAKGLKVPVIINTAMELDKATIEKVMNQGNAMVMKNNKSNDRLLDEVTLFLKKVNSKNPTEKTSQAPNVKDTSLANKNILLVDDDMRNTFALSAALQAHELRVSIAGNGFEALDKLRSNKDIDLVLMDIMMPEMDGYTAMKEIRKNNDWKNLPIIALTAKAMKNDKELCIEAGANDYISKPVDIDKLLSLMKVWLSK